MVPSTILGKLIGTCCHISGVLMVSLPVPIIASKFQEAYTNRLENEEIERQRLKRLRSLSHQDLAFHQELKETKI